MKFKITVTPTKRLKEGETIPRWYGIAWVSYNTSEATCMPIPFNLLVAAARAIYVWIRWGYRTVPGSTRDAYGQGYMDGRQSPLREQVGFALQHSDGIRWRTLDGIGMPDWTDDPNEALVFRSRDHADRFGADDPDDVRIRRVKW